MGGHDPGAPSPLTSAEARALAEALITGTAGPSWASRNKRHLKFLRVLWGEEGGAIEHLTSPPELDGPIVARPEVRRRLDPLARRLIEAIIEGDNYQLSRHLDQEVWALWPDGVFGRFPKEAVLEHLADRRGKPLYLSPSKPFVYSAQEARTVLALGIPEALDELFNLRSVLLYTYGLEQHGRVLIVMRPEGDSGKLVSLPLPAIDDARAYSVRASTDEHAAGRSADRFVRHTLLGHGPALESMRNEIMPALWWDSERISREQFVDRAGGGAHRLAAAELIFGGSHEVPLDTLPMAIRKRVAIEAKAMWRQTLEALQPRLFETVMVRIDPHTLGPGAESSRHTLLLRTEEIAEARLPRAHWRVGGWFDLGR